MIILWYNIANLPEGVTIMADRNNDHERDELFRRIYKIATDLVHAGHVIMPRCPTPMQSLPVRI